MSPVISVENLSKTYRLGQIGTGTFSRDLKIWWAKMRGNLAIYEVRNEI
jgi:lipopolysaccharide transport system ATP-binding protein